MKALKALALIIICSAFALSCAAQANVTLTMSNVTRLSDGTVQLEVRGTPGSSFLIEASTDLQHWEVLVERQFVDWNLFQYVAHIYTLDAEGLATVPDGEARSLSARFYRARTFPGDGGDGILFIFGANLMNDGIEP